MIGQLLLYSLIGGLFSLIGGLLLVWRADLAKRIMLPLISFAAGAFLGASFLDILPEALELGREPQPIFIALLVGFMLFLSIERLLMRYFHRHEHGHEHADHTESLPFLLITGDALHNFLDGIVIALAFLVEPTLGLVAALAVAAHEVPQEIGDFSILLSQGWSKARIIAVNIFQSLMTIPGVLLGYFAGQQVEPYLPLLLAGTAGIFIYIAASDLIPEIHHQAGHRHVFRVLALMIFGIVTVGVLSSWAHARGGHDHGVEPVYHEQVPDTPSAELPAHPATGDHGDEHGDVHNDEH